jgi:hypothetical protein
LPSTCGTLACWNCGGDKTKIQEGLVRLLRCGRKCGEMVEDEEWLRSDRHLHEIISNPLDKLIIADANAFCAKRSSIKGCSKRVSPMQSPRLKA